MIPSWKIGAIQSWVAAEIWRRQQSHKAAAPVDTPYPTPEFHLNQSVTVRGPDTLNGTGRIVAIHEEICNGRIEFSYTVQMGKTHKRRYGSELSLPPRWVSDEYKPTQFCLRDSVDKVGFGHGLHMTRSQAERVAAILNEKKEE